jgi:hypothetical protein
MMGIRSLEVWRSGSLARLQPGLDGGVLGRVPMHWACVTLLHPGAPGYATSAAAGSRS